MLRPDPFLSPEKAVKTCQSTLTGFPLRIDSSALNVTFVVLYKDLKLIAGFPVLIASANASNSALNPLP